MIVFIIINLVSLFVIDRFVEKTLLGKEINKDIEVLNGVANNILSIERITERLLANALKSLEDYLLAHPNASLKELKSLKDKLNVTSLITFDKAGRYLHYVKDGVKLDKEIHEKLKHVSLFKKPYSASYRDLQNKSGYIIQLPFFFSATRKLFTNKQVITKSAAVWLDNLQMYLCVTFDEDYIHDNFDNNLRFHKELLSISICTPSGIPLIQAAKSNYQAKAKIEEVKQYSEEPIIQNNNNLELILPFGGLQQENGSAINKGLANSNNEYFYILKADFSKKELNKQIISIRFIFAVIFILMTSIFYLVGNQFKQRALHMLSLKNQAQQVHHDIANPVQSVDWGINQMLLDKRYDESRAVKLRDSIGMIKGIMHDLYYLHDNKFKRKELIKSPELLYPILDSVISSAKLFISSTGAVVFQKPQDWSTLVNVDSIALRRALLNLVKNSIESLDRNGIINIEFYTQDCCVAIKISDNGCGMDENNIQRLISGKSIYSKDTGRGLGFPYAKQVIEGLGGCIKIRSKLNKGTEQIITLPIEDKKPAWFIDHLELDRYETLVVVDDNLSLHEIYRHKFSHKNLIFLATVGEFERYMDNAKNFKQTFFFIDHCLDVIVPTGIDLIKRYQLGKDSILITNMYLEKRVKDKCLQYGIKILPKGMIEFI